MKHIKKIIEIGSVPIASSMVNMRKLADVFGSYSAAMLQPMLELRNGFYAFEGALHVMSDCGNAIEVGIFEWNAEELWRRDYEGMADDALFFAEDIFGIQFCLWKGNVATFDPETGQFSVMSESLDEWAARILENYRFWTGYPIAHEWQLEHGPILPGTRLIPITPFVAGGEFSAENVHVLPAVTGMKYRAAIALQIRDMPDGTSIRLRVID